PTSITLRSLAFAQAIMPSRSFSQLKLRRRQPIGKFPVRVYISHFTFFAKNRTTLSMAAFRRVGNCRHSTTMAGVGSDLRGACSKESRMVGALHSDMSSLSSHNKHLREHRPEHRRVPCCIRFWGWTVYRQVRLAPSLLSHSARLWRSWVWRM